MQSSLTETPPPVSLSANHNNTVDRINILIKKLDTKLEQLSCLSSGKCVDVSKSSHSCSKEISHRKLKTKEPNCDQRGEGGENRKLFKGSAAIKDTKPIFSESSLNLNVYNFVNDRKRPLSDIVLDRNELPQVDKLTSSENLKCINKYTDNNASKNSRPLDQVNDFSPYDISISLEEFKLEDRPIGTLVQSESNSSIVKCFNCMIEKNKATEKEKVIKADNSSTLETSKGTAIIGSKAISRYTTPSNLRHKNNTSNLNLSYKLINNPAKMNVVVAKPLQLPKKLTVEHEEANTTLESKTLHGIYRARVIDAYRNRQIFTVFGNYNTIRRALLKRGWLEKLPPSRHSKLQNLSEDVLLQHAKRGNDYEAVAISKIINHFPAFFVWQPKAHRDLYTDVLPYRNRIRRTHMLDFSTKVGLIGCAEQQLWYLQDGVAGMLYPRFYRLGGNQEEQIAFIDDFRITQCRSLLQCLVRNMDSGGDIANIETGTVSPNILHFAVTRVRRLLDDWENVASLDIEPTQIPDTDWTDFLVDSAKVLNLNQKFKCTFREATEIAKTARPMLLRCVQKRPDLRWDGYKNLWILKPGYQSRGLGIIIRNNIDDIMQWSVSHSNRRYIVQKYIEQPLLIYRTKFDIRQYMLVFIRESTVQIWLYRDCYLRFSSQEYSMDDLREVVHLTNNSVQKKYKLKPSRDPRLPKNNMWSLDQFKAYLRTQTKEDVWESRVFDGFCANLIAVVMASLDETSLLENSFELYGCDFMLDEQYNPILIEINSTPDMSASTDVTARICPLVMQDCIKVIVDLPRNSRAMTGQFRLAYEVNYKFKQDINSKDNLNINGKSVELCSRKKTPTVATTRLINKIKKQDGNAYTTCRKLSHGTEAAKKSPYSDQVKPKLPAVVKKDLALRSATKEALALRYTTPK